MNKLNTFWSCFGWFPVWKTLWTVTRKAVNQFYLKLKVQAFCRVSFPSHSSRFRHMLWSTPAFKFPSPKGLSFLSTYYFGTLSHLFSFWVCLFSLTTHSLWTCPSGIPSLSFQRQTSSFSCRELHAAWESDCFWVLAVS